MPTIVAGCTVTLVFVQQAVAALKSIRALAGVRVNWKTVGRSYRNTRTVVPNQTHRFANCIAHFSKPSIVTTMQPTCKAVYPPKIR